MVFKLNSWNTKSKMSQSIKINYFVFETLDYEILCEIFHKVLPKRDTKITEFVYKNTYSIRNIEKCYISKILEIAEKYFERYGYGYNNRNNNYFIELSRYNCIKNDKPLRIFEYHKDDKSTTDCIVNTIIFYLKKNDSILGGDLKVKINNRETCIPIEEKRAICFKGDLLHTPTEVYGEGVRECIVVHIER